MINFIEAMRAGIKITEPLRDKSFLWSDSFIDVSATMHKFKITHACALGCALMTAHEIKNREDLEKIIEQLIEIAVSTWPQLAEAYAIECPAGDCSCIYDPVYLTIHLNDYHGWLREDIADFLDLNLSQEVI